jgi:hypothetical protein
MKQTILYFSLLILLGTHSLFAQSTKTHFDNKSYVEGEFLIQLTSEKYLKDVLQGAPSEYKLEVVKYLSADVGMVDKIRSYGCLTRSNAILVVRTKKCHGC